MRIISYNINGLNAILKKNIDSIDTLSHILQYHKPDILCLQETKATTDTIKKFVSSNTIHEYGYLYCIHNSSIKKGYSGVVMLSKIKPLFKWINFDMYNNNDDFDNCILSKEGRICAMEFENTIIINVYVPSAGQGLKRIREREEWENLMKEYICSLKKKTNKDIIYVGDLNVCPTIKDCSAPSFFKRVPGGTVDEMKWFEDFLVYCEFVDIYRQRNPKQVQYTNYCGYRWKNLQWRIDMFLLTPFLVSYVVDVFCLHDIVSSDHYPIVLDINI